MKKIIFVIVLLLISFSADARMCGVMLSGSGTASEAPAGSECTGMLICENAEDAGTPADWTNTGSVDWDVTSSPLRGDQSVATDNAEVILSPSVDLGDDFWLFFRFRVADGNPSSTNYVINIRDASANNIYRLAILAAGGVRHYNGTANQTWATSLSDGASGDYCVWGHAIRGAGTNNGESHTWIDLCSNVCSGGKCTRPASESITAVTAGTWDSGDGDADNLYQITAGTSNVTTLDQIYVSTSEISTVRD